MPATVTPTLTPAPGASSTGLAVESNNSTFDYCFLQAQNWVGVDVTEPDCGSDPDNLLCTDPDAATRIVRSRNPFLLEPDTDDNDPG